MTLISTDGRELKSDSPSPTFEISKPAEALRLASILKDYATQNKLVVKIDKSEYAMVEAWQFAGSQLGILPRITKVNNLSDYQEIKLYVPNWVWDKGQRKRQGDKEIVVKQFKYEAHCELFRLGSNEIIGTGFAICTNIEKGKESHEEYAIASMAQTRCIGKAYRLTIGWLMKAAGFVPTPAEEVTEEMREEGTAKAQAESELDKALKKITTFKTETELIEWSKKQQSLHYNEKFRAAVMEQKRTLQSQSQEPASTKPAPAAQTATEQPPVEKKKTSSKAAKEGTLF